MTIPPTDNEIAETVTALSTALVAVMTGAVDLRKREADKLYTGIASLIKEVQI